MKDDSNKKPDLMNSEDIPESEMEDLQRTLSTSDEKASDEQQK